MSATTTSTQAQITASAATPTDPVTPTSLTNALLVFDGLPDGAFVREAQLVKNRRRPEVPAPLPFSPQTLWRKVKAGSFPKPVKLSEGVTAWRVGDVRSWIAAQTRGDL